MLLDTSALARTYPADAVHAVADCRERIALADGRRVILCPVDANDANAEQAFVGALSPSSRYRRFHFGLRSLPEPLLREMTQIDQRQHVALVARPETADSTIVADARYVRTADTDEAEFAVMVADAWQGIGLGRELLQRLARHAHASGVRALYGDVLWGNEPMIALLRALGGGLERHPTDATLVRARFEV
ncbi:MAG TPA: GNAT family N-acetyltransferase [Burkholderiaceae bacterium]|nr:GNAT family N-acetyltransferase [Burkholderiaceae bacterium]